MDFISELQRFIAQLGFQKLKVNRDLVWIKEEESFIKLLRIIPETLPGQNWKPIEQQEQEMEKWKNEVMIRFGKKVDCLTLIIFRGMPKDKIADEMSLYPNVWGVDKTNGRILLYEKQRAEFYGLRRELEQFLIQYQRIEKTDEQKELRRIFQPVNTAIVAVNLLTFVILSIMGNVTDAQFMAEHGAMVWSAVVEQKEFYRLFTSTFLHFGIDHLLQNMIILLLIGARLERLLGRGKYLIVYVLSGIIASGASLCFTLADNPYTVSAGASGAIFGVMGGLLLLIVKDVVQRKRHRIEEIGLVGILFMIVSALSYGFSTTGVDNAAHLGGLIAGFILTGILTIWK